MLIPGGEFEQNEKKNNVFIQSYHSVQVVQIIEVTQELLISDNMAVRLHAQF